MRPKGRIQPRKVTSIGTIQEAPNLRAAPHQKIGPRYIQKSYQKTDTNFVRAIQVLNVEMMDMISPKLYESQIEGIVPTKNVQKGEWKLLVHKNRYTRAIGQVHDQHARQTKNSFPQFGRNNGKLRGRHG